MADSNYISTLRKQLVTYARGLGCSADEATDVVQDVMLKAIEKELVEYRNTGNLPYLKTMVKNRFIDLRRQKLTVLEDANIMQKVDYQPDERKDKALLEEIGNLIDNHKYGYIIHEMQKRGVHKIKNLAPYTNEKAQTLYKRYQKLVKDLKKQLRGGVWPLKTCFEGILSILILILAGVIVSRVNPKK